MADLNSAPPLHFIGIGAQKAGTTWLYDQLRRIPHCSMPYEKEMHYFDRNPRYPSPNTLAIPSPWNRMQDASWRGRVFQHLRSLWRKGDRAQLIWYLRYYFGQYGDRWYLNLLSSATGIRGDITPSYSILNEHDVERMAKLLPGVKLIFLLRDPIERSWSHFRFNIKRGTREADFGLAQVEQHLRGPGVQLRGDHLRTLAVYERYFAREDILIGFYDAIVEQPLQLMQGILTHIGGDASWTSHLKDLDHRSNPSPPRAMDPDIHAAFLAAYRPQLEGLSERFGGYATRWANKAMDMSPPEGPCRPYILLSECPATEGDPCIRKANKHPC